jgi:hypothetical protein
MKGKQSSKTSVPHGLDAIPPFTFAAPPYLQAATPNIIRTIVCLACLHGMHAYMPHATTKFSTTTQLMLI